MGQAVGSEESLESLEDAGFGGEPFRKAATFLAIFSDEAICGWLDDTICPLGGAVEIVPECTCQELTWFQMNK